MWRESANSTVYLKLKISFPSFEKQDSGFMYYQRIFV